MQYTPREPFPAERDLDDSPVGIVALWRLLWRNKLRIALPAVLLTVLSAILVLRSDDVYTAEAQVLLTRGNLEVVQLNSAGSAEVTSEAIANALTILSSRGIALDVIERLNLTDNKAVNPGLGGSEQDVEPLSQAELRYLALEWLGEVVQVSALPGTNVIVIRVITTDPGLAADVANSYAEAYLDYQRDLSRSESERAASALETRVRELRLQLEEDQQALQEFRGSAQGVAPNEADSLFSEAASIRARLDATETTLATFQALKNLLEGAEAGDIAAIRALIEGNETLQKLEAETLDRQIGADGEVQNATALLRAMETERARLQRLSEALSQSLASIETRIAKADDYTVRARQLEVELDTTSRVYEAALARLKELSIQTGLRDAGAQILTRAEAPLNQSAQGRRRTVAIAGFLGLFLGIAWVLMREAANDRVRRPSDLTHISGSEAVIQIPPAPKSMKVRRARKVTALPNGPFLEGVRSLRQQLLSAAGPKDHRAVVAGIFSALPNEGKSTLANALAQSIGMLGQRILLIDGDMRTGALSRSLGAAQDTAGLSDILSENIDPADAIVRSEPGNFDLLPSGHSSANAADLLESPRLSELIAALGGRYDVILFDTPPILVVSDASRIAAIVERHVFVAAHDRSRKQAIRDALTALQDAGGDRPILALSNVPEALRQQYGLKWRDYARYVS